MLFHLHSFIVFILRRHAYESLCILNLFELVSIHVYVNTVFWISECMSITLCAHHLKHNSHAWAQVRRNSRDILHAFAATCMCASAWCVRIRTCKTAELYVTSQLNTAGISTALVHGRTHTANTAINTNQTHFWISSSDSLSSFEKRFVSTSHLSMTLFTKTFCRPETSLNETGGARGAVFAGVAMRWVWCE